MHKHHIKNEHGFAHVIAIIIFLAIVAVLAVVGVGAFMKSNKSQDATMQNSDAKANGSELSTLSNCTDRLKLQTPVDLTKVSGILLPGQWRNTTQGALTDYKGHGGFRFDDYSPEDITITAPMDAKITSASQYWQTDDEQLQYLLTFTTDCGIMYRFDHIKEVAPKFKKIFDAPFPAAKFNDSKTTDLLPPIDVKAGEEIAVAVGMAKSPSIEKSVFVDFGVWDTENENDASKDAAFATLHSEDRMARIGLCWIDLLPMADAEKVQKMDISSQNQKSDYCTWAQ